jgi:hypothetical protein
MPPNRSPLTRLYLTCTALLAIALGIGLRGVWWLWPLLGSCVAVAAVLLVRQRTRSGKTLAASLAFVLGVGLLIFAVFFGMLTLIFGFRPF